MIVREHVNFNSCNWPDPPDGAHGMIMMVTVIYLWGLHILLRSVCMSYVLAFAFCLGLVVADDLRRLDVTFLM